MRNNFIKKISSLIIITVLFFSATLPARADLSDAFSVKTGKSFGLFAKNMGYATGSDSATVESFVAMAIESILGLLGVGFMVYVFYGGVLWMTASGSEEKVKEAQTIIRRAVIGLAITLLSYSISFFVVRMLTN